MKTLIALFALTTAVVSAQISATATLSTQIAVVAQDCRLSTGQAIVAVTANGTFICGAVAGTGTGAGPAGPAGPQGPAGPVGPAGSVGAQGPSGSQGSQGLAGPAGATGPAGPQGPQGSTGLTGATGATGPQGAQGPAGTSTASPACAATIPSSPTKGACALNSAGVPGIWNGSVWLASLTTPGTATGFTAPTLGLLVTAPASSTAACTQWSWATDTNFYYVCVSTNVWRRVPLATF